MKKRKILFYSPHSFVWQHAFPEGLIAETLQGSGHEIVYVTCGGLFRSFCVCMNTASLSPLASDEEKSSICRKCQSNAGLLAKALELRNYDLASRITPEELARANSLAETVTPESFLELELDGVHVGRLAIYEVLLKYKKIRFEFTDQEWDHYRRVLKGAILSHFASKRVLEAERPDAVVSFNTNYSVLGVMAKNAVNLGVKSYCMTNGGNLAEPYGFLMFGLRSPYHFKQDLVGRWEKYKSLPTSPVNLSLVTDFMLELFKGQSVFVYSAPKSQEFIDVRKRIGASPDQKILVATLSSYDERFSSNVIGNAPSEKGMLFESQIHWLKALIPWVGARPELFLAIRVHPREFPNRREGRKSDHATMLEEALKDLPRNVMVNFPSDKLSLYDLAGETSVFLNSWSSVGKEMCALGIPVVLYSGRLLDYPHDLNFLGETEQDYFSKIEAALAEGWSTARILKTYRWLAIEFASGMVDVRESFRNPPSQKWDFKSRLVRKLGERIPVFDVRHRNLKERGHGLKQGAAISRMFSELAAMPLDAGDEELFPEDAARASQEEARAIRFEMKRLAEGLWGPSALKDPPRTKLQARFQAALADG